MTEFEFARQQNQGAKWAAPVDIEPENTALNSY